MDPQRGLWNCAISTLVQRSSGDKLLGSDLYQEIRLKANNSFRLRSGPSRGEPHQGLNWTVETLGCAGSIVTHTQSPNARISVPIAYLLHVNGAHTNRRDQNAYDPGMDPQRGLWNCAISTLVQRSSGDKLLGSDLYQEIRLKANNSFRLRSGPSRGE
ncbi:hypothetical protein TNCV_4989961 [Trichonephila clavipes]|uniref:Uncharacterized protein n=1 Tax=Trichonephila clavipes TaxID=2585209 RepID=A0A8X6WBB7_TRICX|nr:hypothetical protein TNCV_4989961 [Trichonephila clavipes]